MSTDRLPRVTLAEAKEIVEKIPVLRDLFKHDVHGIVKTAPLDDITDGFLYSSRFKNPALNEVIHASAKAEASVREVNVDHTDEAAASKLSNEKHDQATIHKEQKRKFAVSLATLSAKPHKRATIVKDGGLGTLLELAQVNDSLIQKSCSAALALLSKEPSLRMKMVDEGVIAAVIALSSSRNYYVKVNCCKSLCNLLCENGIEPRAIRDGATHAIIRVAVLCPDSMEICLKALLNLSCVSEKFLRIEEINEGLFYFNDAVVLSESFRIIILSVLCNLSAVRNNQLRLVEDGCLRIVEWAWKSTNPHMRILGSDIIRNLTTEYRTRTKLVESNLVAMLLSMAEDTLEEVRASAVKALYILSRDNSCRYKIVSGNALDVLMKLCLGKFSNIEIGRTTARTWRILSKDPNTADKTVMAGIVRAFLALLMSSNNDEFIQQYIVESICMLLSLNISHLTEKLVEDGVVAVIVMLIQSYKTIVTSEWCAFALSLLLLTPMNYDTETLQNGILPSLIKLCCTKNASAKTITICSASFVNVTLLPSDKNVDCTSAIPILVYLLKHEKNMITKMNCSTALYNLSYNDENCFIMLDSGVLMPIVELATMDDRDLNRLQHRRRSQSTFHHVITSGSLHNSSGLGLSAIASEQSILYNPGSFRNGNSQSSHQLPVIDPLAQDLIQTKIKCASVLSRLTYYTKFYHLFLENGHDLQILKVLLKLSVIDDIYTQRRVVRALSNLSRDSQIRSKLLSLSPIPYILSLASRRDEQIWLGCCSIICNLSFEKGSERLMVEGGIVPTLLITALINTDHIPSKIICVKAIANLIAVNPTESSSKDESFIAKSMVHDGIVWGLSSLAQLDNLELMSICATVLHRLSISHPREIVDSPVAVKTLVKIIQVENNLELLRLGTSILTNVLLKTTSEKDHVFHNYLVQHMQVVARSSDQQVLESFVLCLSIVSQTESCHKAIITSKILWFVDRLEIVNSVEDKDDSNDSNNSIIDTKTVHLSLLRLFINMAKSIDLIDEFLHDSTIRRFYHTLTFEDNELDFYIIRAVYCLTCSTKNVEKLAREKIFLDIFEVVWDRFERGNYQKRSDEVLEYVVASLYNMSVVPSVQAAVVLQGIVRLFSNIWPTVHQKANIDSFLALQDQIQIPGSSLLVAGHPKMLKMTKSKSKLPLHRAMSNRSTSSLSSTVGSPSSRSPSPTSSYAQFQTYYADYSVAYFTSHLKLLTLICSAISHLGCGVINTSKLIEDGCAPILMFITESHKLEMYMNHTFEMDVYLRCSASLRNILLVTANQSSFISAGCLKGLVDLFTLVSNMSKSEIFKGKTEEEQLKNQMKTMICRNCASSLRSLTCNMDEREAILSSGAINVILSDLRVELEDEESLIGQHLLQEIEAESWVNGLARKNREERAKPISPSSLCIDFVSKEVTSEKNVSDVVVDCRRLSVEKFSVELPPESEFVNGISDEFGLEEESKAILKLKITDLVSYEDSEDHSHAIVQQCPKQECEVDEEEILASLQQTDSDDDYYHEVFENDANSVDGNLSTRGNKMMSPTTIGSGGTDGKDFKSQQNKTKRNSTPLNDLNNSSPTMKATTAESFSKSKRNQKSSRTQTKKFTYLKNPTEEKFESIVAMIKNSSKNHKLMDEALNEWKALSGRR